MGGQKIVFFGSGATGIPALKMLLDEPAFDVAAVVTQPAKPAGRKMELCCTAIERLIRQEYAHRVVPTNVDCDELHEEVARSEEKLLLCAPDKVRGNKPLRKILRMLEPDFLVVISFGQLLTNLVLNIAPKAVCVHASELPLLRGPSPVRTALILGMKETQACTFLMTPRMDDGDVLLRKNIAIEQDSDFATLCAKFAEEIPMLLRDTILGLAAGEITPKPQNHADATYCRLIRKSDSFVDWRMKPRELRDFARAFSPDLGIATFFRGRQIKFGIPVDFAEEQKGEPGEILAVHRRSGLMDVACGDGSVTFDAVQPESRPKMPVEAFVNGFAPKPGEKFETPMEILDARPPFVSNQPAWIRENI
ncbi:MAG: hypothetical protein HRF49_09980 [bacterium]